jgi:hypothetical protein
VRKRKGINIQFRFKLCAASNKEMQPSSYKLDAKRMRTLAFRGQWIPSENVGALSIWCFDEYSWSEYGSEYI